MPTVIIPRNADSVPCPACGAKLDNLAKLAITGDLTGTIAQTGNHNIGNLSIAGTPGATVSLTQTGNNQSYVGGSGDNSGEPMTVFTTTSGVSITQMSF